MFFSLILSARSLIPNCDTALPYQMLCKPPEICNLDENVTVTCTVFHSFVCQGDRSFQRKIPCRFCYQLPDADMECDTLTKCYPSIDTFFTECRAKRECVGNSIFQKKTVCKAAEKSQKTAFLLSLFLGGFAADRFYLGYYVIAVFKFLTLGGFGIAYMVDLFLILFGYVGPANGKLFTERV